MPRDRHLLDAPTWRERALKSEGGSETPGLVKQFTTEVKQADPDERTLEFVITTGAVDRDGDIIEPEGWELDNFLANPVVLWSHSHWDPPVARAIEITQTADGLTALAQFPTRAELEIGPNEPFFPGTVYNLLRQGYLSATSVGFMPLEWTFDEERGGVNFLSQELLEFSVVPVPANPEALIAAAGSDGVEPERLKAWASETLARLERAERELRETDEADLEVTIDQEKLRDAITVRMREDEEHETEDSADEADETRALTELQSRRIDGLVQTLDAHLAEITRHLTEGGADVEEGGDEEAETKAEGGEAEEGDDQKDAEGGLDANATDEEVVEAFLAEFAGEQDELDELLDGLDSAHVRAAIEDRVEEATRKHLTAVTGRLD